MFAAAANESIACQSCGARVAVRVGDVRVACLSCGAATEIPPALRRRVALHADVVAQHHAQVRRLGDQEAGHRLAARTNLPLLSAILVFVCAVPAWIIAHGSPIATEGLVLAPRYFVVCLALVVLAPCHFAIFAGLVVLAPRYFAAFFAPAFFVVFFAPACFVPACFVVFFAPACFVVFFTPAFFVVFLAPAFLAVFLAPAFLAVFFAPAFLAVFFLAVFFLAVFFSAPPSGHPACICPYAFGDTVDCDFGRLVPDRFRLLILSTGEFFLPAITGV